MEGKKIIPPKVNVKVDNLLREFILSDGVDIELPMEIKDKNINYLDQYSDFKGLSMVAEDRAKYGKE